MLADSYRHVLRNTNFVKVWASQIFSQLTINMVNFILINEIFENSHSTVAVSLLWIFYSLPAVFLGPFSGFFVDIWDKRKIMMVTNFFQALTVASLLLVGKHFYLIYVAVLVYAIFNQFYSPTEAAVLPEVVATKQLPAANSFFLFTAQLSFLVGFGMASILLQFLPGVTLLAISAGLLLLATLAVALLPANRLIGQRHHHYDWNGLWLDIQQGVQFLLKGGRLVLAGFLIIALFQMASSAAATILPVLTETVLHRSLRDAGVFLVVPLAVGLIGGSYLFSRNAQRLRKKYWIVGGSIGTGIAILYIALLDCFFHQYVWRTAMVTISLFVLGVSLASVVIPAQTFIQEFTPAKIRGRVFSLLSATMNLATILPLLIIASLIDILGIRLLLLVVGGTAIFLGLFISRHINAIIVHTNHRA